MLGEGVRKVQKVGNRAHFERHGALAKTRKDRAKKRAKSAKNERVKSDVIEYLCSIMSSTPVFGRWVGGGGGWIFPGRLRREGGGLVFRLLSSVFCL